MHSVLLQSLFETYPALCLQALAGNQVGRNPAWVHSPTSPLAVTVIGIGSVRMYGKHVRRGWCSSLPRAAAAIPAPQPAAALPHWQLRPAFAGHAHAEPEALV